MHLRVSGPRSLDLENAILLLLVEWIEIIITFDLLHVLVVNDGWGQIIGFSVSIESCLTRKLIGGSFLMGLKEWIMNNIIALLFVV